MDVLDMVPPSPLSGATSGDHDVLQFDPEVGIGLPSPSARMNSNTALGSSCRPGRSGAGPATRDRPVCGRRCCKLCPAAGVSASGRDRRRPGLTHAPQHMRHLDPVLVFVVGRFTLDAFDLQICVDCHDSPSVGDAASSQSYCYGNLAAVNCPAAVDQSPVRSGGRVSQHAAREGEAGSAVG